MWNLILICLEKVQVSVPDRCKVYAKHTKGLEIILDIADVLLGVKSDRGEVPDLLVSGDNFDLVVVDPHDLTTMSEPEAPMQSLNQLPMVTNLAGTRLA
jgi:hypothetical protein